MERENKKYSFVQTYKATKKANQLRKEISSEVERIKNNDLIIFTREKKDLAKNVKTMPNEVIFQTLLYNLNVDELQDDKEEFKLLLYISNPFQHLIVLHYILILESKCIFCLFQAIIIFIHKSK